MQADAPVCGAMHSVDILLTVGAAQVSIDVDGPQHFVFGSDGRVVRQTGAAQLRDFMLRHSGFKVVKVNVVDCYPGHLLALPFQALLQDGIRRAQAGTMPVSIQASPGLV